MSVASPCICHCQLDDKGELCVGCWRRLDEIMVWSALPDEAKLAVIAQLGERRDLFKSRLKPDEY